MGFMPVAPRAQEAVPLLLAPELFTSTFPYPGVGMFIYFNLHLTLNKY